MAASQRPPHALRATLALQRQSANFAQLRGCTGGGAHGLGTRYYPWAVIYGLSFPKGSRMARLELPEFEYVPLWAIQSGDKEDALKAVDDFRALEAKYMPQD